MPISPRRRVFAVKPRQVHQPQRHPVRVNHAGAGVLPADVPFQPRPVLLLRYLVQQKKNGLTASELRHTPQDGMRMASSTSDTLTRRIFTTLQTPSSPRPGPAAPPGSPLPPGRDPEEASAAYRWCGPYAAAGPGTTPEPHPGGGGMQGDVVEHRLDPALRQLADQAACAPP